MISRRFTDFLSRLRKSGQDPDRARLAAILELNRALARVEDRRALLTLLLDEAVRLFGAERGFVVLPGSGGSGHAVAAARSLDRESVRNPERKLSSSIINQCLGESAAVFCEDAQEGDFGAAQSVADMQLRSVLCTPLQAADNLLGCLYLDHRFQSGVFASRDLPWLQAFADQAAIALHLHGLLDENREFARATAERNQELEAQVAAQAAELTHLAQGLSRDQLDHEYAGIVGRAPALLRALHLLDRIIPGDYPVLIGGESGTGKELIARAIHAYGARRGGPFVAVNVAAIQPSLLESELFGHVRGAFTGADRDRRGLLRQAEGGVLFLDEVTEMDPEVQVVLLRFLEAKVVRPVGGERALPVDVRVVAATNRALDELLEGGVLREDLYYRLAAVTVEMPPLRERRGDIPELVGHFLAEQARGRPGEPAKITPSCVAAMVKRGWPGNLRQLKNEVQRLEAMAGGSEIGPELLSSERESARASTLDLAELERATIKAALERAGGNKSEAARLLGISRRSLYNKLGRSGT